MSSMSISRRVTGARDPRRGRAEKRSSVLTAYNRADGGDPRQHVDLLLVGTPLAW